MRRFSGTTVTGWVTILTVLGGACLTLKDWRGDSLWWVIAGFTFFGLATLVFLICWVLPRRSGGGSSSGGPADEAAEKPVDPHATANSRGNVSEGDRRQVAMEVPPNTPVRLRRVPPDTTVSISASEEAEPDGLKSAEDESSDP